MRGGWIVLFRLKFKLFCFFKNKEIGLVISENTKNVFFFESKVVLFSCLKVFRESY